MSDSVSAWTFDALDDCTVNDVKTVLQASELARCITSANALVDGSLVRKGLTVPTSTPQIIVSAAKHFAAWRIFSADVTQ